MVKHIYLLFLLMESAAMEETQGLSMSSTLSLAVPLGWPMSLN